MSALVGFNGQIQFGSVPVVGVPASNTDAQNGIRTDVFMTPATTVAAIQYLLTHLTPNLPDSSRMLWENGGLIAIS